MTEGEVIMGETVGRRRPGVCGVAIAAFAPEIPGMEYRVDVAFRTCRRYLRKVNFQMAVVTGDTGMTSDEWQGGVGVVEYRLAPGRFLMADVALNSVLSFVLIFRNVAGIARCVQTEPLFVDVTGGTLHTYVRAVKGIIRQVVIDGYGLPIQWRMTLIAIFPQLSCMFVLASMTIDALMGGGLQIGDVGGDLMTRLAGHVEMGVLEGKPGLLVIEVGAETVAAIVASETI